MLYKVGGAGVSDFHILLLQVPMTRHTYIDVGLPVGEATLYRAAEGQYALIWRNPEAKILFDRRDPP